MPSRPRRRRCLSALAAILLVSGMVANGTARAGDLTVFAAASLGSVLDALADGFGAETGHRTTVAVAGSSTIARQVAAGAPADIVFLASAAWTDWLASEGVIDPASRVDLLGNTLVLIAHDPKGEPVTIDAALDLRALLGEDGRLAMALVDAVPAGQYGKAALTGLGLWDSVAPQVAQTDNVRAALALVALGEARYGIVYATDAAVESRVTVKGVFPPNTHDPIVYPVAAVAGRATPATAAFLGYLQGPEARAVFEREGFAILPPPARG